MNDRTRSMIVALVFVALATAALGVAGCTGSSNQPAATTSSAPVKGGTLTIGYEQEPQILNAFVTGGDMQATKDVESNVLLGLVRVKPDFSYEPMLAEQVPDVANGGVTPETSSTPFSVTWKIRKNAVWSDGVPVTADDVKFTLDTMTNPKYDIVSRAGYEDVSKAEIIDSKTIKLTFKRTFAPYREMFSVSFMVLPKHALEGKDFNKAMNDSLPLSDGPFVLQSWVKGDSITLVRNDKYWGRPAYLDKVVWKWVPEANTEVAQLKTGEVEAVNPSPDPSLLSQLKTAGVVQADPGTNWEHLAFNLTDPVVSDLKVRQAIAYGIDRDKIVSTVMLGQVKPLQGIFVPEQGAIYTTDWSVYTHDKAKAQSLLQSDGYTMGSDGFFQKNGQRLSLEFKTTSGNTGRQKMFEIMQAQLKDVGIDVKLAFEEANTFFSTSTPQGKFQVGEWAWVASPDPTVKSLFAADQLPPNGQNYYHYNNPDVTAWINQADSSPDMSTRVSLSKQISAQMAKDLPLIPLYQRLSILATKDYIHGALDNATLEGAFWNLSDWWKEPGSGSVGGQSGSSSANQ